MKNSFWYLDTSKPKQRKLKQTLELLTGGAMFLFLIMAVAMAIIELIKNM